MGTITGGRDNQHLFAVKNGLSGGVDVKIFTGSSFSLIFDPNSCFFISSFISGLCTYLTMVHDVPIPPNQYWYCTLAITILFSSFLCSTLLILSMTFDRFYSIIMPHKAASFNTVKRAKMTILCIVLFSIVYNIPHCSSVPMRTGSAYLVELQ